MVGKLRCFACKKQNEPKYSFPRDESRLVKWMKILSLDNRPKKSSRICEEHFHKEDLLRTEKKGYFKVQKDALPIIYHHTKPDTKLITSSGDSLLGKASKL